MSEGVDVVGSTYEILFSARGIDEARDLAREVQRDEAGIRKLIDAIADHERSADRAAASTTHLADSMGELRRQAERAESALGRVDGKLSGVERSAAKARAGFFVANTLQDVIQGGPASGINNILGAGQDSGIRALGGELVAAAGGVGVLTAAIGTLAVVAGAAFVVIDEGLKSNTLGWSDLGSVVDEISGNEFSKAGEVISRELGRIREDLGGVVGGIAEWAIGWNTASEAVAAHKREVDRATESYEAFGKASRAISGVKSAAQEEAEKGGKSFGKELADLGGEKGLAGVIDQLAGAQAGADADKVFKRKRKVKDKDGNVSEVEEEVTGRQLAAEGITRDVANAVGGDAASQEMLKKRLGGLGLDASDLGHRGEAEAEKARLDAEANKAEERRSNASAEAAQKDDDEDKKALAHEAEIERKHQEARLKFEADAADPENVKKRLREAAGKAEESAPGVEDLIRSQLKAAGNSDQAALALVARLGGTFGDDAARGLVSGQRGKAQEELMSEWIKGPEGKRRNSQVIGAEGLANSIQSAVGGDDTAKKQLEQLQRQTLLLDRIARQRGGAVQFGANGQLGN